jgi:ElaB/YqjD/DUF883 family membrane-anchored ribosome-binding protein
MPQSHHPYPQLDRGRAGDKDGPATDNPDFPNRKTVHADDAPAARPAPGFAPITPPPPPPPEPRLKGPPTADDLTLVVKVGPGENGKFVVTIGADPHATAPTRDVLAARQLLRDFEDHHRERPWAAVGAAVAAFHDTGPGKVFNDARDQLRTARADLERLEIELSGIRTAWTAAAAANDDEEASRREAEQESHARLVERGKVRLSVLSDAFEQARRAAVASLPDVAHAARREFLAGAVEREAAARAELEAAVLKLFPAWLAAYAERHAAETAGSGAAQAYSQPQRWAALTKVA